MECIWNTSVAQTISLAYQKKIRENGHYIKTIVGVVCYLVISVDVRPYFTGIAPNIISSTNAAQNFTIA